jgi:hypothetical protein
MKKPQGYKQAAAEKFFCLFVLCLPYYQSLLFAGVSGSIYFLLLTCLLMFVVARSAEVFRTITARLRALPLSWFTPPPDRGVLWISLPSLAVARGPSLSPLFQRPPPIFS